ncbi:hypothetical protein [Pelagibaculum spongiae]|uniref:Uncharacterized protein n=1 Tax=Pelagibaculum spongiae TaxID=2080658 RepID=A0A2V1GZN5_9GAMM|nr:hypothetical protein [Pelagibaculum spongiae]PVZ71899.1 hypothetical protein DC094_02435 [Pelagibaculum spongiae]
MGNNCYVDWTTLNRTSAARASAFEHLIPEMLFNNDSTDPANAPQAVSAVKALQVAAQQGQKIFTLTQENIDQLNNISIDSATKNEIRNAISQGKTVQVHEREINYFGWSGSGYIIENPETGSGAYKITGGANGSWEALDEDLAGWLTAIGFFTGILAGAVSSVLIAVLLLVVSIVIAAILVYDLLHARANSDSKCRDAFLALSSIAVVFVVIGFFVNPMLGLVALYASLIAGNSLAPSDQACKDLARRPA